MTFLRRYLGEDPTVLAVGFEEADTTIAHLEGGLSEYTVRVVPDAGTAGSVMAESVVCVLSRFDLPDATGTEVAAELQECAPSATVLVLAREPDGTAATEIADAGGRLVPGSTVADRRIVAAVRAAARVGETRVSDSLGSDAFDQLLSEHEELLYIKNADGQFVAASSPSNQPDPETYLGKTDMELAREHEKERPEVRQRHEDAMEVMRTGVPLLEEVDQFGSGQSAFWHERTILPWTDDGGTVLGVVGVTREVSKRRRRGQSMQTRIDQLERFTSFVSHDLRSPLQVASSYLELAREGDDTAFERLEDANDRMQELIDDLETLVSDEEATVAETRAVRITDIARDVWHVIGTDSTTLEIEMPDDTVVNAAESTIRPILENLFKIALENGGFEGETNARDSSRAGGSGSVGKRTPEEGTVWFGALDDGFYVEHDGPGISPDLREAVFEQHDGRDDVTAGFAIVLNAADSHNWEVMVSDGRDGGDRFAIRNCMMVTEPGVPTTRGRDYELDATADVGNVLVPGEATDVNGVWTVSGAGNDIWRDSNDFHFVYTEVDGPVEIRSRLVDMEEVNPYSKAGLMIRDSLDDDATHGYIGQTAIHGTETLWCTESGSNTVSQQLDKVADEANWFRLSYDGDRVTASISTDGSDWQAVDQRAVPLSDSTFVGLAVCSVVPRALCTATFDDVQASELLTDDTVAVGHGN